MTTPGQFKIKDIKKLHLYKLDITVATQAKKKEKQTNNINQHQLTTIKATMNVSTAPTARMPPH